MKWLSDFVNEENDYRLNWTPLNLITIIKNLTGVLIESHLNVEFCCQGINK